MKEASSRTKALINNRDTTSITAATAAVLEKEQHIDPKLLINVMDKRADVAIKYSDKIKEKATKRQKKKDTHTFPSLEHKDDSNSYASHSNTNPSECTLPGYQ